MRSVLEQFRIAAFSGVFYVSLLASLLFVDPAGAISSAIVVLSSETMPHREAAQAYRQQLEQERMDVTTVQFAALDDDLLAALLEEGPEVITAIGTEAAVSLNQRLPAAVPLTYCMVSDPSAAGLTARPNAYGISVDVPLRDQMQVIAQALPHARAVGMLYQSDDARSCGLMQEMQDLLPAGWRLAAVDLNDHLSIADAVSALMRAEIDVVWTAADSAVYDTATVRALLLASVRQKVPVFGFSSGFVRSGALLGVSIDATEQGRHCAQLTLRAVCDTGAETEAEGESFLPHVSAPRYRIEVNRVVAEMLGVDMPESLHAESHHVYVSE